MNTFYEKLHSSDFFDCPKCGAEVCIRDIVNGCYYCRNCNEFISKTRARRLLTPKYQISSLEAAYLAQHVYGTPNCSHSLHGWEQIPTGLTLDDFRTGLRSTVYYKEIHGQDHFVYAFAGTKGIDPRDWYSNFSQLVGKSPQHNLAVANAEQLCERYGNDNITYVGHSLGGGLAALCSMVTGARAITFNAANVNSITKRRNYTFSENKIDAYVMTLDPLNAIQSQSPNDDILDKANGTIHYVSPSRLYLKPLDYHSIEAMIESLLAR